MRAPSGEALAALEIIGNICMGAGPPVFGLVYSLLIRQGVPQIIFYVFAVSWPRPEPLGACRLIALAQGFLVVTAVPLLAVRRRSL